MDRAVTGYLFSLFQFREEAFLESPAFHDGQATEENQKFRRVIGKRLRLCVMSRFPRCLPATNFPVTGQNPARGRCPIF
jgi:hypothetical protein